MADIESLSPTKAVYQSQGDLRSLHTKIIGVTQVSALTEVSRSLFKQALPDDPVVVTEETIFHVQGGGQPSDTGRMVVQSGGSNHPSFLVQSVRRSGNGTIFHQGQLEPTDQNTSLQAGQLVEQLIDGEKRDLHSRIHSAGHLLGLAVRQLSSEIPNVNETKAQHYPDAAFVEFQGKIDPKHRDAIQKVLDDLVQQDLPINVTWLDPQGLKERGIFLPDAFHDPTPGGTRVVEIGELGGYPCGGTHVHSTAKLGRVVVGKISTKKGNTKIAYTVG
ncbi:ThrRS/AlaRS common domain-containing protein [Hypoxylon trugodes]|uniref:ThrRS/AlaRS common domain-containing protein n=1 Tax=Hypoxylon trugodes TaxID=326681 RepID=UPI00219A7372|nr:ThrRS/AlaRS common domain-containing protein [Hypoxylon trugodes]KAI1387349.1 ThrRS/AlaRS common domain-containing protein [Hypoxylon trugodes]